MYIVFCSEISSMGKKFENMDLVSKYIEECLKKFPKAEIKTRLFVQRKSKNESPKVD